MTKKTLLMSAFALSALALVATAAFHGPPERQQDTGQFIRQIDSTTALALDTGQLQVPHYAVLGTTADGPAIDLNKLRCHYDADARCGPPVATTSESTACEFFFYYDFSADQPRYAINYLATDLATTDIASGSIAPIDTACSPRALTG